MYIKRNNDYGYSAWVPTDMPVMEGSRTFQSLQEFSDRIAIITTIGSPMLSEIKTHLANVLNLQEDQYKVYEFPKIKPGQNTNHGGDQYNLWHVLTACYNPDPVSVDISKSHLHIIEEAYKDGCQILIVFEDDARFEEGGNGRGGNDVGEKETNNTILSRLEGITNWLHQNMGRWDLFYFGCMVYPPLLNVPITTDIDQTLFPMGSHAYAITRTGMERVLANSDRVTKEYVPIDSYYRNDLKLRKFMAYPSLNNQCKPPAIFTKTAHKLGINRFVNYEQCCWLFELFSHHSLNFLLLVIIFFILGLVFLFSFFRKG